MGIPVIYVLTHDSIGVGEDGPTHQPIEHLAMARATPGLIVLRPADANEVVEAWQVVMQFQHEPALLVLTRQAIPTLDRAKFAPAAGLARGAYVLADNPGGKPDVLLLATGSEVSLASRRSSSFRKKESRRGSSACRRGNYSRGRIRRTGIRCCRPGEGARFG